MTDPLQEAWENAEEWIGVDLDGTLAEYDEWRGMDHIGRPIPKMVERVKVWLADGQLVKILTARANTPEAIPYVKKWLVEVAGLPELEVTNVKAHNVKEIWDDKARQVVPNTGDPVIPDSLQALLDQTPLSELSFDKEQEPIGSFLLIRQIDNEKE